MRTLAILKTGLLTLLLTLAASGLSACGHAQAGAVNANLASGPQNLGPDLHRAETVLNGLTHQGKTQSSTTATPESPVATRGQTLRRFVRQDEFSQIQGAISTGGNVRLGRFFTPDNITDARVATSQLALPGTGRNPIVGFVDVPVNALPSQPLTRFGPRLTQPFTGSDLVRLPGGGLEVEFVTNPVVSGSALRLVPTP